MNPDQGNPSPRRAQSAVVLCIAGFDPCGGAGLLADARAVAAWGAHAVCAQTALVPQNTRAVVAIAPTAPELLRRQLEVLGDDIAFHAIKIGLLPDVPTIEIVGAWLRAHAGLPVVVDPVLAPTRGLGWSDAQTLAALREHILPRATLITPNLPEAQILGEREIADVPTMCRAARALLGQTGAQGVLIKGGHLPDSPSVDDVYADAGILEVLSAPRIAGVGVRGTGCLLASAIAAQLAQGVAPLDAVRRAKTWMSAQWQEARAIGGGRRVAVL